ncbi:MAG TPA: diacylglycerol kinase [Eggerthellaceae bacterium]|nr:diacylglycerol kinase [Eggerthellaceae bacterium]
MAMNDGNALIIANPAAQRGNGRRAALIARDLLGEWLGADRVSFELTKCPGHATDIAAYAPRSRFSSIVAIGGDGLVHEVVNGLMALPEAERPRFGLIPVGSGNDYARTLGMSECVPDAIVQFLDAPEVKMDIGCCNGEHFAETISFGLDAAIAIDTVQRRQRTGEQGTTLYLKSGIDQLLHHLETYKVNATLDDARTLGEAVHLLTVQIGPTYGGGFRICPDADPTDGLFDVCYACAPMRVPEATFKFLRAKNAHHTRYKKIRFDRASKLHIEFDRRPPCQIDGEAFEADAYDITVAKQALTVLAPAFSPDRLHVASQPAGRRAPWR